MNIVCPMRITYHMSNWMSNWIHLCLRWMLLCHCRFFSNIVCIYLSILSCLSRKYKKLLIVLISFKGFRGMNFHWHLCKLSLLRWLIVLGIKGFLVITSRKTISQLDVESYQVSCYCFFVYWNRFSIQMYISCSCFFSAVRLSYNGF